MREDAKTRQILLTSLVDIGCTDIYRDAWEYAGRVAAMRERIALAQRELSNEPVRASDIERACSMREADVAPEDR